MMPTERSVILTSVTWIANGHILYDWAFELAGRTFELADRAGRGHLSWPAGHSNWSTGPAGHSGSKYECVCMYNEACMRIQQSTCVCMQRLYREDMRSILGSERYGWL